MDSEPVKALNVPPFPPLTINDLHRGRVGRDTFRTWVGWFSNPSGVVDVEVHPPVDVDTDPAVASRVPPLPAQIAAYQYLKASEADVTDAVVRGIFEKYPTLREWAGANEPDSAHDETTMPVIHSPEELKRLVGPRHFIVLSYAKDGVAYVGMEFHCTWDPEHNLGVMTHQSRVLAVDEGDMSFDTEVPRIDGGRPLRLGGSAEGG